MILPPRLRTGDKIAVFSPSSPATVTAEKRYQRGKAYLEEKGFSFQEGILTEKQDFYRSGSIAQRAEELNRLIHDDSVKCIMAAIGGMNSNSLLPYIDYEYLKEHPKIIIGYSDVTALLLGIYARTGLVTFYGPAVHGSISRIYVWEMQRYPGNFLCQSSGQTNLFPGILRTGEKKNIKIR